MAGLSWLKKEHPILHYDLLLESSRFRQSYRPDVVLHVGVDEAGYGPLLGPLVVGVADGAATLSRSPG